MKAAPQYIVPLLVEQPTWGGEYIAEFKQIQNSIVAGKNIGQAFELAADSMLSSSLSQPPSFGVASATDLAHPTWVGSTPTLSLQQWIDHDPVGVLGNRAIEKFGPKMNILIKFTQAKNNSYQVHVQPGQEFGHWRAKPESWFYLEPGQATLGLAPGVAVAEYQARCKAIDAYAQDISRQIKAGELSLNQGKQQLAEFIDQDHPRRFVNTIQIKPHQIIDLSQGGIHHSWEVGEDTPMGNIVYEVQVDVRDENCTLRSFDQGNIKSDGSVRPLTISDYFTALNTDPAANHPDQYSSTSQPQTEEQAQITTLFDNQYYKTQLIDFAEEYSGSATKTNESFHHLFAQVGTATVITPDGEWLVPQGWSLLIPASIRSYKLKTDSRSKILATSV